MKNKESKVTVAIDQPAETVLLKVGGIWRLTEPFPRLDEVLPANAAPRELRVVPDALVEWDSSLPLFLLRVRGWCHEHAARLNLDALPDTLKRLFQLISASEEQAPALAPRKPRPHPVARAVRRAAAEWKGSTQFIGECALGTMEVPTAPRHFHWKAFLAEMVETGPKALPIVGLLSFLIGVTFAFETSIQLARFGLQIYVIQGIGGSVLRQIGPLIAAVLLAGRTGAAFAAHIANMKLGGEIDALEMLGVSPVTFLVLPRLAALILIMPLITLYSDVAGILGGLAIATVKMDIPAAEFWVRLQHAISLTDLEVGLAKSLVFAIVIGLAGTLRGLQSERSSVGVGHAVTSAVVTGIAATIVTDALFSPILHRLGF
jgi:phospholipid/cholesterol/gamma-HCH transport system permease protein